MARTAAKAAWRKYCPPNLVENDSFPLYQLAEGAVTSWLMHQPFLHAK